MTVGSSGQIPLSDGHLLKSPGRHSPTRATVAAMELPRKPVMLYNIAVMENPRASTDSEDDHLRTFDTVHSGHILDPTPFAGVHAELQSPPHSVALTMATTTSKNSHKYRVLSTATLVGIVYFASCGGPVGSEPLFSTGGPLLGLVGVPAYVALCLIPLLFAVTELSCSFPENGGHAVWAMTAFGPFWGFQSGYWSWVGSVLNNAIYPGLIYATIAEAYGFEITSSVVKFVVKAILAIVLALPNYLGVRAVGVGSLVFLVFVMGTVLMLTIWSAVETDGAWYVLSEVRASDETTEGSDSTGIDWTLLVHTLFWSFDGMFSVSVIGGEVINPARTFPHVMIMTVALSVITYMLPWIFVFAANKMSWREMTEDSLPSVAEAIGGSFLHQVILITSIVGSIGLYTCSLFYQSFLVQGMAQSGLLPSILRKRNNRFKTPIYANHVSLIATLCLVGFEFETILNMTNAFSGMLQILIVLSMIQLRRTFPYLPRPVRMPGNLAGITIMLVPVTSVFCFLIISTFKEWNLAVICIAFAIPGLLFPFVRSRLAGLRFSCC